MESFIQKYWAKLVSNLKAKRKSEKISQKNLAAISGVSFQTISRFEQADENIQLSTVLAVCESLGAELILKEPYSFRVLLFKILIDGQRNDPYFFASMLHNADPGHPVYKFGAENKKYPFPEDDNETKNPVFQFMKSVSDDMIKYDDVWEAYPLIQTWQDFCSLVLYRQ